MKTKAFAIVLSALTLASCSEVKNEVPESDTIKFDTYTVGATYTLLNTADLFQTDRDISFSDSVSLTMPSRIYDIDISTLRDSITSFVLGNTDVTDMAKAIKASLDSTASELGYKIRRSRPVADPDGFSYTSGFVVYLNPEMLVYCVSAETYDPGAAHGMTSKRYINYYILSHKQGRILTLNDIFTPKGLKELPDLIAERAQDMSDVIGPTSVEGLPQDGNFIISSEGQIVFVYQPYEIASYAQGFINVAFDPYELLGQLTPFGIDLFRLSDLELE